MKRFALIVGGALLIAIFFVWIYVRDHSSLAAYVPTDDSLRLVVNLVAWSSLLGGVSLFASAWVKHREVQRNE